MGLPLGFGAVFGGSASRPIWDTVIARVGQFALVPTKGSIIPRWLLVVPELSVLNFAKLKSAGTDPLGILPTVAARLNVAVETLLWFEHGACLPGTTVGCGVDHAHLHVLVAPDFGIDEFRAEVEETSGIAWKSAGVDDVYSSLDGNESYYVFGNSRDAWSARDINLGSQFFRKVVARLAGKPDEWDYKLHDGRANVDETLRYLLNEAA